MPVVDKTEALRLLSAQLLQHERGACPLCRLVAPEACAANAISSNEHGVVLLNRFGQRRGHLMVVSLRHVEHVHELDWPAYAALQQLAHTAAATLQRVLRPERVFIAVLGCSAPLMTSYAHLHIHVIPIYETDERARPARVLSWSEGVVVYEDAEAQALADQLRGGSRATISAQGEEKAFGALPTKEAL
jgi:diadenosine tetraphosphate (Ap4A) HIT family hydrolase